MSTANQHDTHDPNSLLYYAPRRLRDGDKALRSIRPRPEDGAQSIPIAFLERLDTAALGERTQDTAPLPSPFPESLRSLEPEAIESLRLLSQRARRNQIFAVFTRFAAVVGIAAGIAFLYVVNFTGSREQAPPVKSGGTSVAAMPQSETAPMDQPPQNTPPPNIAVADADTKINQPLPVEIEMMTTRPVTTTGIQTSAATAFLPAESPAPETARRMDPKEIAALIKRGEELLSNGDISAARLLLQRAAETHDARAAFVLAGTYDPMVIGQFSRGGGGSDMALARVWYQRARDWGSPDAPRQLEALASANR
jgi:hypothetical protein